MSQSNWKEYFNDKAKTHGGSVMTSDYFNEKSFYIQRENTLRWLGALKGKEILDAGCGVGAFSETLVKENTVHGVDFSEKSLEFAKKRGLTTHCGDLGALPYENGKFDLVLCIGVIQLITDYRRIINELARVTKPGGTLLIETLNRNSLQRKMYSVINKDKKFDLMYTREELEGVFKQLGFGSIEFMNIHHPLSYVTYKKDEGFIDKCFSTSFAIKGVKVK